MNYIWHNLRGFVVFILKSSSYKSNDLKQIPDLVHSFHLFWIWFTIADDLTDVLTENACQNVWLINVHNYKQNRPVKTQVNPVINWQKKYGLHFTMPVTQPLSQSNHGNFPYWWLYFLTALSGLGSCSPFNMVRTTHTTNETDFFYKNLHLNVTNPITILGKRRS